MLIKKSILQQIIREEAKKSLQEGFSSSRPLRSAGLTLKYQNLSAPNDRLAALETDIRLVFYGGSLTSSFFNMTAGAGMFLKDLYFGDGGDFDDMGEAGKESIVKKTYDAIKSNTLTAVSFHAIVVEAFKLDTGTAGDYLPQKEASTTTQGTDTYFAMLAGIQQKFASGAPAVVDPAAPPATATGPS